MDNVFCSLYKIIVHTKPVVLQILRKHLFFSQFHFMLCFFTFRVPQTVWIRKQFGCRKIWKKIFFSYLLASSRTSVNFISHAIYLYIHLFIILPYFWSSIYYSLILLDAVVSWTAAAIPVLCDTQIIITIIIGGWWMLRFFFSLLHVHYRFVWS